MWKFIHTSKVIFFLFKTLASPNLTCEMSSKFKYKWSIISIPVGWFKGNFGYYPNSSRCDYLVRVFLQYWIIRVRPLGWMGKSLPTDQEASDFRSGKLFHGGRFCTFIVLCPFYVLHCLWREPMHSNDHKSGEVFQLRRVPVFSIEPAIPCH